MERTNARFIESLPEPIQIAAIDASFISLKVLLPVVKNWLTETKGSIVALIKPQFEAGQKAAGRGKGVILDENIHQEVVYNILDFSSSIGLAPVGLIQSPLTGPKGNREFLIHLVNQPAKKVDVQKLMAGCFPGRLQVNQ